jgi:UPF0271 protein
MHRNIAIDLNADLGEECGNDEELFQVISSANIAAGGHAGGGSILLETVHKAIEKNVCVGAHPSYPDRENFGRISRAEEYDFRELMEEIKQQVLEVASATEKYGQQITHVKPHGALYHDAHKMPWVAEAIIFATSDLSDQLQTPLYLTGLPGTMLEVLAKENDQTFVGEGFADRTYQEEGTLTPRTSLNALIETPEESSKQVLDMILYGNVTTLSGQRIPMKVQTICLHGDTHNAVALAHHLKNILSSHSIAVSSPQKEKVGKENG